MAGNQDFWPPLIANATEALLTVSTWVLGTVGFVAWFIAIFSSFPSSSGELPPWAFVALVPFALGQILFVRLLVLRHRRDDYWPSAPAYFFAGFTFSRESNRRVAIVRSLFSAIRFLRDDRRERNRGHEGAPPPEAGYRDAPPPGSR